MPVGQDAKLRREGEEAAARAAEAAAAAADEASDSESAASPVHAPEARQGDGIAGAALRLARADAPVRRRFRWG
jgi:hypothetical protein